MRKENLTAVFRRTVLLAAGAVLLFAASSYTYAQQTQNSMPGGMMQPGTGMQDGMMGQMMHPRAGMPGQMGGMMQGRGMMGMGLMSGCPMMAYDGASHVAGQIAFLKAELGITDAQKAAWDAYASALTQVLESMQSMHQRMMQVVQTGTPLERLDARINAMEGMVTRLKQVRPALADLYAGLTDEQKRKAAELLTGTGCMT